MLVALVVLGLPRLQAILYNPDTQSMCGRAWSGGGQFPDVPGDGVKVGEVFSRDKTYLSWIIDGTAIPFSVGATLTQTNCGGFPGVPFEVRYEFYINTGGGWVPFRQDDVPEGVIALSFASECPVGPICKMSAREITIDGTTYEDEKGVQHAIPDGSALRVVLGSTFHNANPFGGDEQYALAQDEILLVSGLPHLQRGAALYQIGDTGRFSWTIPVAQIDGATAYFLSVTNENTGQPLSGWDRKPLSTTTGVATFPVTADLFSTSSGARNAVRARLYSQIFQADVTEVSVIDNANLAPTITSVMLNQREFREGDTVSIHISASPNPGSSLQISRYHVLAHIEGDVVYDQDSTSPDISFRASRTGILSVEAIAYDSANRPSPVYEVQATVGNVVVDCEVYPDLPRCAGGLATGGIVVAIVLLVIGILLVTFNRALPLPVTIQLLIMLVGIALAVLGGYLLVTQLIDRLKVI